MPFTGRSGDYKRYWYTTLYRYLRVYQWIAEWWVGYWIQVKCEIRKDVKKGDDYSRCDECRARAALTLVIHTSRKHEKRIFLFM